MSVNIFMMLLKIEDQLVLLCIATFSFLRESRHVINLCLIYGHCN